MIGVNDLAKRWDNTDAAMGERYMGRVDAAADLVMLAETAWKPVSEPPTEYGIEREMVLIWHPPTESMEWCAWDAVEGIYGKNPHYEGAVWSRWRDVVLMPPQGGE